MYSRNDVGWTCELARSKGGNDEEFSKTSMLIYRIPHQAILEPLGDTDLSALPISKQKITSNNFLKNQQSINRTKKEDKAAKKTV